MSLNGSESTATKLDDQLLIEECRAGAAALERAIELPPLQLSQQADVAERAIVSARNRLIDRLRQHGDSPRAAAWHSALDELNIALSLVVSGEYPAAGVQREPLEQARDILRSILSDGHA